MYKSHRPRLICLPYAGGTQYAFLPWQQLLHEHIEVIAPELPGRGRRLAEAPITELHAMVAWLRRELRDVLCGDYALWGHSMGALLAYELARAIDVPPNHMFLSAALPPHRSRHAEQYHTLDDAGLTQRLARMNGTPAEVLADRELMALLLPTLRADFALCETYTWRAGPDVPRTPLTIVGGDRDPHVALPLLDGWRSYSSGAVRLLSMAGDHFFLRQQVDALGRLFVDTLAPSQALRSSA